MKKKLISVLLLVSIVLSSVFVSSATTHTVDEIVSKAAEIIKSNEGDYGSVNKNDNGALSIGWIQWHGNRALELIRTTINYDKERAKNILGEALYNEIRSAASWSTRILTDSEASKISTLMVTSAGKNAQDKLAASDIRTYVLHGQKLGITSATALVYFADMENQCGSGGATRVANSAIKLAGSKEVTLAILHQAALADSAAGKYASRRNKVYNYALLLGWEDFYSAYPYQIWTVNTALNIRTGAGTSYSAIAQYPKGTTVIVYEKALIADNYWGRTSVGWICLTYCTLVRSVAASTNTHRIKFDANGGDLNIKEKSITAINGVNSGRPKNTLTVYTPEYGTSTGANKYGTEVIVGPDGIAKNTPRYGIGNSTIPAGGFVVSAHGTAAELVYANIQKGDYVVYNAAAKTIDVYSDYNSYIASTKRAVHMTHMGTLPTATRTGYTFDGWYSSDGTHFTESTTVYPNYSFILTARWSPIDVAVSFDANLGSSPVASATTKVDGVNVFRNENMLVIYDSGRGKETSTNKWGTEASVSSAGVVTAIWEAGTSSAGSHPIPSGGFVISGHQKMSDWILKNIKVGDTVKFDKSTLTLNVYSGSTTNPSPITVKYDSSYGELPIVKRTGYTFLYWYDTATGEKISSASICKSTSPVKLKAKWTSAKPGDIDENGRINSIDYAYLKKELLRPGSTGFYNLDVDQNGKVNVMDYAYLKKMLLGKAST